MLDLIVLAGQTLSVIGLGYGWYVAVTYDDHPVERRLRRRAPAPLLHHLAMA